MRRYLPSLLLLLALMAAGGYAIYQNYVVAAPSQGYYLPTLSSDPAAGHGLLSLGVLLTALVGPLVLGGILALAIDRFSRQRLPAAEAPAKAAPAAKGEMPAVPLNDQRSLIIFWVALGVISVSFLVLRFWGMPQPYLPLIKVTQLEVFRLPGDPIPGLPSFIAGPGNMVTVWQLAVLATLLALGGTIGLALVLYRALPQVDGWVRAGEKLPRTAADELTAKLISATEKQMETLRAPRPKTGPQPANWVDQGLMTLNVVMLLVLVGVIFYNIPALQRIQAVNRDISSTQAAALFTPTPPRPIDLGPGSPAEAKAGFEALPKGDAANGQTVFNTNGCAGCHALEPDKVIVGPSQVGVATRAATRKPDYTAEMYLYESVTNPNASVAPGFNSGIMPQTFKQSLKPQDLADVIAFLMTLK